MRLLFDNIFVAFSWVKVENLYFYLLWSNSANATFTVQKNLYNSVKEWRT